MRLCLHCPIAPTYCREKLFLNTFKLGLYFSFFMEDSVRRGYCSEWCVVWRRGGRRKVPSMPSSVSLKLSPASFQTLLPSVHLCA